MRRRILSISRFYPERAQRTGEIQQITRLVKDGSSVTPRFEILKLQQAPLKSHMSNPALRLSAAQKQSLPENIREHLVALYAEVINYFLG